MLRRFLRDEHGVAAIEFAFVLPVMLGLLLGGLEITNALQADRKTTAIAASVADLYAQAQSVSNNDRDNIFAAATALIAPFNAGTLKVVVSSIIFSGGQTKVAWSDATANASPRAVNSVVNLPPGLLIDSTASVILAEVSYHYSDPLTAFFNAPGTGSFFTKGADFSAGFDFGSTFYDRPRRVISVGRTP